MTMATTAAASVSSPVLLPNPPRHLTPLLTANATRLSASLCNSPTTSTDSHSEEPSPQVSPTTAKLPGLQFAISSHRRTDLNLPHLNSSWNSNEHGVHLSMSHCETPHYLPGVPTYPEKSPMDKKMPSTMEGQEDDEDDESDTRVSSSSNKKGTRRGTLNAEAKNVLKAWMFSPQHFAHPYPSEEEKEELALEAGIQVKQLSNWFTNARKRLWQPVLRQSGVEVKNFLSTGRGGPRGNKLDVSLQLQQLINTKEKEKKLITECLIPETNNCSVPSVQGLKRSWHDIKNQSEGKKKKKKNTMENDSSIKIEALTKTASQLSQELRSALTEKENETQERSRSMEDLEFLAAASLLGLQRERGSVY